MRRVRLVSCDREGLYVTNQQEADAAWSQVLNEIKPGNEQLFLDTESCARPEWKHEWGIKNLVYKPGLDPYKSRIRLVQLGFRESIWIFDMFHLTDVSKLRLLIEDFRSWKWMVNGKHDYKQLLWDKDIVLCNIADMMAGAKLLNLPALNLKTLAYEFLGQRISKEEQVSDWSIPDLSDSQLSYAADDIGLMQQIRDPLVNSLKKRKLWIPFFVECNAIPPAAEMELNGTKLNRELHKSKIDKTRDRETVLREEIIDMLEPVLPQMCLPGMKTGVNLGSPQKLLGLLQSLGLDIESTSKKELKLKALDHPVTEKILEFKKCSKMIASFGDGLLEYIHPVTGRAHPNFHGLFTRTLRFSSSDFNVQQIPRDLECRAWFVPDDGYKLVMADYAAIEFLGAGVAGKDQRVLDIFRRKLKLIQARQRGETVDKRDERLADPHYVTAQMVTDKDILSIIKDERQDAKPVNFGYIYGQMPAGFRVFAFVQYGRRFTLDQCCTIRNKFFSPQMYFGLSEWHKKTQYLYRDVGIVTTMAGYQIPLTYNTEYESFAGPAALNYQVQNPCAVGNKRALALLWKRFRPYMNKAMRWKGPMLVRTVHDENHLEAPESMAESARLALEQDMKAGMDKVFGADDLVSVEANIGTSWADKA
jgi:DNA polymerase I